MLLVYGFFAVTGTPSAISGRHHSQRLWGRSVRVCPDPAHETVHVQGTMSMLSKPLGSLVAAISLLALASGCSSSGGASTEGAGSGGKGPVKLLNVSYDPTRELYEE